MCERERIIAVDFYGCLCENAWPYIGKAKQDVIDALLSRQKAGAKIILWTCRVGEHLDAAVDWCRAHGITFDAINENLPLNIATYGNDCRKIYADEYWDDKACNPEICNVSIPFGNTDNPPMLHIYNDDETARRISEERTTPMKAARPEMPGLPLGFTDIPINPGYIRSLRESWNPQDYPGHSPVVPTNHVSIRSEVFVVLREMARMFLNGTLWDKKARIVLEYDPDAPKMEIKTFMERGEALSPSDREWIED